MPLKKKMTSLKTTKLEEEKAEKKKRAEDIEEVLTTGQESSRKGSRAVIEIEKDKVKKEYDALSDILTNTTKKRKRTDKEYLLAVRDAAVDYLVTLDGKDYPGWKLKFFVTDGSIIALDKRPFKTSKGLLAVVISPDGEHYAKGMTASFDPLVDVGAARNLAYAVEDSLDYFTGQTASEEKPKIWIPKNN